VDDRERWDRKYRGELGRERAEPDPFVLSALERLAALGVPAPGADRALDLASGTGRHALELARRGWRVWAWDVSPVGLEILASRSREAQEAATHASGSTSAATIETHAVDVLANPRPDRGEPFDLVVSVLFLDRDLFGRLSELVVPGGHLVFATVTVDHSGDKPPARFRLESGELTRGVPGFETVHAAEARGRAGILARRVS
jgi:SAM-dependent methyltransferase